MAWAAADLKGVDTRKLFKSQVKEWKPKRGRPPKLPVEIKERYRSPQIWVWFDFVHPDQARAGAKLYEDWARSGLEPAQTQQFREDDRGRMAQIQRLDWSRDDKETWTPPTFAGDVADRIGASLTRRLF